MGIHILKELVLKDTPHTHKTTYNIVSFNKGPK